MKKNTSYLNFTKKDSYTNENVGNQIVITCHGAIRSNRATFFAGPGGELICFEK